MPTNYNGEFMPPRLSFPSSCSVEGETSRHNPMSCTANVLPPFGGRVLPGHYVVVVVEVEVNRGGTLGDELDVDEVALKIGPTPCSATPEGCGLDIAVKALEPLRSGLAVHSQPYNLFPVDFVTGGRDDGSGSAKEKFLCESGCTDLVVTVTDHKTHKRVEGATLDVSVAKIPSDTGTENLCETTPDGDDYGGCGTYLLGLKTDQDGQAHLRYWAPGEIRYESTKLSVTAKASCSGASCPGGQKSGATSVGLNVSPYLIYEHAGLLSDKVIEGLVEWRDGGNAFTKFLDTVTGGANAFKYAVQYMKAKEIATENLVKGLEGVDKVEPVLTAVEALNILIALGERQAMIAEFLYATDLNAAGLGDDPFEASADGAPSMAFSNKMVANYAVAAPFQVLSAGAWWDLAWLIKYDQTHAGFRAGGRQYTQADSHSGYGARLYVYEVSTCDPAKGACLPGYGNDPGSADVLRPGVTPALYFELWLTYRGSPEALVNYNGLMPYDALAWTESQWDLKGVVRDSKTG
jgi:hypothetical protein